MPNILTAEEQKEWREEIDYLIEIHGYEYVWGYDTPARKIWNAIKETPERIAAGIEKTTSNPTLNKANDKLRDFAMRVNAGGDGLGGGGGLGGDNAGLSFGSGSGFGGMQSRQQSWQPPQQTSRQRKRRPPGGALLDFDPDDHL